MNCIISWKTENWFAHSS